MAVTLAPVIAAGAVLIAHARRFAFVTDDAFISFVYARNLVRHGALVWRPDEVVEGYTNFLWTVLLAGFHALGAWLPTASAILGVMCALATLFVVVRISERLAGRRSYAHVVAPLLLAMWPGFACWSQAGLETPLFTLLITAGIWRTLVELEEPPANRWLAQLSCLLFALAALTRPEGVLIFTLVMAHRALWAVVTERRLRPTRHALISAAVFVVIYGAFVSWRYATYGWPFPNTFYVKAAFGKQVFEQGWRYVRTFFEDSSAWLGLVLLPLAMLHRGRAAIRFGSLAALIIVVYSLYVASVGGDFMGSHRFMVPLTPLCALIVQEGIFAIGRGLDGARVVPRRALAVVAILLFVLHSRSQWHASKTSLKWSGRAGIDPPGRLRDATRRWGRQGRWLARHARRDDVIALGAAGAIAWYADIRVLDCHGLSDEYVAHHAPVTSIRPGHQKFCPPDYVARVRPSLIGYLAKKPPPADLAGWADRGYYFVLVRIPGVPGGLTLGVDLAPPGSPRLSPEEQDRRLREHLRLENKDIAAFWHPA